MQDEHFHAQKSWLIVINLNLNTSSMNYKISKYNQKELASVHKSVKEMLMILRLVRPNY